jgi:hypothetical protein
MEPYSNFGGDSGVQAYEFGEDSITVRFRDGSCYLYDCQSAGTSNISRMKELATAGRGLNSFINRFVKKGYASRLR